MPYAFRREVGPAQPAGAVTKWSLNRGLIAPFSSSPPDYRMKFPRMLHAKWQSSRPPLAPIIPLLTAEGRAIFYTSPQSISASFREIRPFFLVPPQRSENSLPPLQGLHASCRGWAWVVLQSKCSSVEGQQAFCQEP